MRVSMFLPRFHDPIRAGTKRQTIRKPRKNPIRPEEVIALRGWSGSPYRSKQFDIVPPVVVSCVSPVALEFLPVPSAPLAVTLRGETLLYDRADDFARADGFVDAADMAKHFQQKGVDMFEGVLIEWETTK